MKHFEPNIVVVDDKIDEVQGIIDYYWKRGAGCKYFNPDIVDGDTRPSKYMSDVTLLFLDLFYSDGPLESGFDAEICAAWVRAIVPPNVFYILVVWTKDESKADAVLSILNHHDRKPYLYIQESKTDYLKSSSEKYDYSSLLSSVNRKIESISAFEEIQNWKNTLKKTSNVVLGGLLSGDTEVFTNKLKTIIKEHGGEIVLLNTAEKAIREREILFDALNHVLISNAPQYNSENEISEANINGLYNISGEEDVPVDKQLNSWFHFVLMDDLNNKIFPGIIAKNNSSFLRKLYSIQDDNKVKKLLISQHSPETIIEDIAINITRPCDYAQNKYGKNIKLISGIAIKKPKRTKKNKVDWNGQALPDSIKCFDHLYYDDTCDDLTLLFDFRYSFSLPEEMYLKRFKNIRMFTKELLSDVQVSYSNYVSRLGYTKFL